MTVASTVSAQQFAGFEFTEQSHVAEVGVLGGYAWTTSKNFSTVNGPANVDFKSSEYWGVEIDLNVRPGAQLVLLWTYQDTDAQLTGIGVPSDVPRSTPLNIQYWQIGGLSGMQRGNVMPYGKFTLGATKYSLDDPGASDEWQFSMILGLGAKMYPNDKIAIRLEGALPFTYFNGGMSVGIGTGGAGVYVGGNGVAQWTVTLGVNVLLGKKA
jgi:opacity protein-like surface antigen